MPDCTNCADTGHACEDHPAQPWEGIAGPTVDHQAHGAVGIPCPSCCEAIALDGTHSISEAFSPRTRR